MTDIIKRKKFDAAKYKPITEFFKLIENFVPPEEYETLDLGIFDRKVIKGIRIKKDTCFTLKQTADYINVPKKTLKSVWLRHKKDLQENLDWLQNEATSNTIFFPLRGILKLLKWTRSGFADRFYDSLVDYIMDNFSSVGKSRYEQLRIEALSRDKYTCQRCGKPGADMHHKFSQTYYPHLKYDLDNVEILCYDCHEAITKDSRKRFEK